MNKIQEAIEWRPFTGIKNEEYEKSWFCNTNKTIHANLKQYLNCKYCICESEKVEFEKIRRLLFFSNHYLGDSYKDTPLDVICRSYNIKLEYFRPWK